MNAKLNINRPCSDPHIIERRKMKVVEEQDITK